MINFEYIRANNVADAVRRSASDPSAKFIAGGTNLIDLMKNTPVFEAWKQNAPAPLPDGCDPVRN